MTHEQILQHCIEMANKRKLAYLKASNPYKGTAEKLFNAKCRWPSKNLPKDQNIEQLISTYGDREEYMSQIAELFQK